MGRFVNVTRYSRAIIGTLAGPRRHLRANRRETAKPITLPQFIWQCDPCGREARNTCLSSELMPSRFSSKYTDPETSRVYYGYRFYDADASQTYP